MAADDAVKHIVEVLGQDHRWDVAASDTDSGVNSLSPGRAMTAWAALVTKYLGHCGRSATTTSTHSSSMSKHAATMGVRRAQELQNKETPPSPRTN